MVLVAKWFRRTPTEDQRPFTGSRRFSAGSVPSPPPRDDNRRRRAAAVRAEGADELTAGAVRRQARRQDVDRVLAGRRRSEVAVGGVAEQGVREHIVGDVVNVSKWRGDVRRVDEAARQRRGPRALAPAKESTVMSGPQLPQNTVRSAVTVSSVNTPPARLPVIVQPTRVTFDTRFPIRP